MNIFFHLLRLRGLYRRRVGPWPGLLSIGVAWLLFLVLPSAFRVGELGFLALAILSVVGSMTAVLGYSSHKRLKLLLFLCLLRLLALGKEPFLSDDHFRYIHEGRAVGVSFSTPYTLSPAQITPEPDDGITSRVNHPDIPAAYPPLTELIFWSAAAMGDAANHPFAPLSLILLIADLLILIILYRRGGIVFLLYGAHPIPLLEITGEMHIDGFASLFLVLAFLSQKASAKWKGVWIGLAAGIKPLAFLCWIGLSGSWRSRFLGICISLMAFMGPALPFLADGADLHKGILEYATRWEGQPLGFAAIKWVIDDSDEPEQAVKRYTHAHFSSSPLGVMIETDSVTVLELGQGRIATRPILLDVNLVARGIALMCMLFILVFILSSRLTASHRLMWAFATFFFFSPTIHPWYLVWLIPFICYNRSYKLWVPSLFFIFFHQPAIQMHHSGDWCVDVWPRYTLACVAVASFIFYRFVTKANRPRLAADECISNPRARFD
jgi:alpha-1,6-mannosyltransferase